MGTTFISVEEEEAEEYISRLRKVRKRLCCHSWRLNLIFLMASRQQYENEKRELETKKAEVVEKMEVCCWLFGFMILSSSITIVCSGSEEATVQ